MQPVFLVMGTPASGKSTVAKALASRFGLGIHIPVDDLRQMVVGGLSDMNFGDEASAKATALQIRLARESASGLARIYNRAGFAVVIDDFWFHDFPGTLMNLDLGGAPEKYFELPLQVQKVVLLPSIEVTLERLENRSGESDSYKQVLAEVISFLHPEIQAHPKIGWHVVDSSHLSIEQTVDAILEMTRTNST